MSIALSRPRRSTVPVPPPPIEKILEDSYDWTEDEIHSQFKSVCKYFKEDPDKLADFWLTKTEKYNLRNSQQLSLLSWIFEKVGLAHDQSVTFLDTMTRPTLREMGIQRVETKYRTYYRNIPGEVS